MVDTIMSSKSKKRGTGKKRTGKAASAAAAAPLPVDDGSSPRSRLAALLFCGSLGFLGAHRFYAKRYLSASLMLVTVGFLLVGVAFDLVAIIRGRFRDATGRPLRRWRTRGDQWALLLALVSPMAALKMAPLTLVTKIVLVAAYHVGLYHPAPVTPPPPTLIAPQLPPLEPEKSPAPPISPH